MGNYLPVIIIVHIVGHRYQKVVYQITTSGLSAICMILSIILSTGKLENIPSKWLNQSPEWKKSNELVIYKLIEKENNILVEIP